MCIFDRYHHSWAADTPAKYKYDSKHLQYTFATWKFPVNGDNEQSFSNPHPRLIWPGDDKSLVKWSQYRGGGYLANFLYFIIFPIFQYCQNTVYL